jgi:hypothetical protein
VVVPCATPPQSGRTLTQGHTPTGPRSFIDEPKIQAAIDDAAPGLVLWLSWRSTRADDDLAAIKRAVQGFLRFPAGRR